MVREWEKEGNYGSESDYRGSETIGDGVERD